MDLVPALKGPLYSLHVGWAQQKEQAAGKGLGDQEAPGRLESPGEAEGPGKGRRPGIGEVCGVTGGHIFFGGGYYSGRKSCLSSLMSVLFSRISRSSCRKGTPCHLHP